MVSPENHDACVTIESPCTYAQGIIPATPGYTVLGQLSAKLHLASHVASILVLTHGILFRYNMNGIINDKASQAIMDTCHLLYNKPEPE